MTIEIKRYEQFYTVAHTERRSKQATTVEFKSYSELIDYVLSLLSIAKHQILEEVVIIEQHYLSKIDDIVQNYQDELDDEILSHCVELQELRLKSKANGIIPTLDDDDEEASRA